MEPSFASLGLSDAKAAALAVVGAAVAVSAAVALINARSQTTRPKSAKLRTIHRSKKTLPVLGDALMIAGRLDDFFDWITEEIVSINGEPFRMSTFGQPDSVILTLPEAVEAVTMTHFDKLPKGPIQIKTISTLFGRGMLASDGERWYHQRKTAAKFFSAKVLRTFLQESVQKTLGRMTTLLDNAIAQEELVDLQKIFHDFTLDTFVEMALGVDLNCISTKELHPFQEALDSASPIMSSRATRPTFWWKFERWLGVGPEGKFAKYVATMHDWLSDVIQQSIDKSIATRANPDSMKQSSVKNVIELFLEQSNEGADGIQKEDLIDFVLTFVIAARDTTADTLGWFFYALARHPNVEASLREEMTKKLHGLPRETFLTPEHIRDLVYLEACIKETLRLYPAAPYTFRQAMEDTIICDDILLKKGELVAMAQYAMGRLPRIWGEDATEFKPERWIDLSTGKIKQVSPTQLFTFSAGPRACIGMNLATMELRAVTANLLFRYKLDVDHVANGGGYVMAPTLHMKNPLLARVSRV